MSYLLIGRFNETIRLDRDLFVRDDTSTKVLSFETPPKEGFFTEMNHRKRKWILYCFCHHEKNQY